MTGQMKRLLFALFLLLPISANAQYWDVNFNYVDQTGYPDGNATAPPMAYVPLHYSTVRLLSGVSFNTSSGEITIQTAGLYLFGGQTWVGAGMGGSNPYDVTKLYKNGVDMLGCTGIGGPQFLTTSTMGFNCIDYAQVGDVYQMNYTGTAATLYGTITVNGHPSHSNWHGAKIQ